MVTAPAVAAAVSLDSLVCGDSQNAPPSHPARMMGALSLSLSPLAATSSSSWWKFVVLLFSIALFPIAVVAPSVHSTATQSSATALELGITASQMILCNTSGGDREITFPLASTMIGEGTGKRYFLIVNTGSVRSFFSNPQEQSMLIPHFIYIFSRVRSLLATRTRHMML